MNPNDLGQLVLYIVNQVTELGGYTTTIRLVKFLYLIDLEHYRRYGKKLTDLKWFFYHYGPYAFALPEVGKRLGFDLEQEEFETLKGKFGRIFRVREPQELPKGLRYSVESMITGLLQVWADQETPDLLSYVYKTEPMVHGIRGQELDFSVVPQGSRYYELYVPLDSKTVKEIKESFKAFLKDESDEYVTPLTKSNAIEQASIQALEGEDIQEFPGIFPKISDENGLRDSLPKGD